MSEIVLIVIIVLACLACMGGAWALAKSADRRDAAFARAVRQDLAWTASAHDDAEVSCHEINQALRQMREGRRR